MNSPDSVKAEIWPPSETGAICCQLPIPSLSFLLQHGQGSITLSLFFCWA